MRTARALSLLLLLCGCGPKTKIQECQALIGTINGGVDKIHKTLSAAPEAGESVAELRALATAMDDVAKQTEGLTITTDELKKLAQRYDELAKDVAGAARELASAVEAVDSEKVNKQQAKMEEAVKREDPLVEDLNKFCQAP